MTRAISEPSGFLEVAPALWSFFPLLSINSHFSQHESQPKPSTTAIIGATWSSCRAKPVKRVASLTEMANPSLIRLIYVVFLKMASTNKEHRWFSGKIHRCQGSSNILNIRWAPCSIHGRCKPVAPQGATRFARGGDGEHLEI